MQQQQQQQRQRQWQLKFSLSLDQNHVAATLSLFKSRIKQRQKVQVAGEEEEKKQKRGKWDTPLWPMWHPGLCEVLRFWLVAPNSYNYNGCKTTTTTTTNFTAFSIDLCVAARLLSCPLCHFLSRSLPGLFYSLYSTLFMFLYFHLLLPLVFLSFVDDLSEVYTRFIVL